LRDRDEAARSAALGRIYNDLGFEERGLVEGWHSLTTDPTNYSAHRLLADTYASRPRHEIARVSELLQSQLLQPLNITPVQPQLAESDPFLLEGSGPAEPSFNEFNPLFTRNRLALQASGIVGGNNTFGEDVAQAGILGPFSYSLGQFHLESDGFRNNNDIDVDIYNVFMQSAITPKLNLQAEYRRQEREQGDLQLRFDPDAFLPSERQSIEQDIARLGARYSPTPSSELLVSSFYTERTHTIEDLPVFLQGEAEGYQVEAQYIYNHHWFNGIVGGGIYRVDNENLFQFPGIVEKDKSDDEHANAYFYSNLSFPRAVTWTLGLSYDSISTPDQDLNKIFPKLGLQWSITDRARLRLAYFRTLKRVVSVEQTIEPTNIAGFNQFFDDANGTETERYGIGLDATLTKELYGGLEYSHRELAVPGFSVS
ncbi:MAG: TonB-dependent receptor domain-containing protein, partial [Gammaproteobacteria bacterium]